MTVGIEPEDLKDLFAEVTLARRLKSPWSVSAERDVPINIARKPFQPVQEVWPALAGRN